MTKFHQATAIEAELPASPRLFRELVLCRHEAAAPSSRGADSPAAIPDLLPGEVAW